MESAFSFFIGAGIIICAVHWRRHRLLETASEEELTRLLVEKKKQRLIAERAEKSAIDEVQNI